MKNYFWRMPNPVLQQRNKVAPKTWFLAVLLGCYPPSIFLGFAVNNVVYALLVLFFISQLKVSQLPNILNYRKPFLWLLLFFLWMALSWFWSSNVHEYKMELQVKSYVFLWAILLALAPAIPPIPKRVFLISWIASPLLWLVFCFINAFLALPGAENAYAVFVYENLARPTHLQPLYFAMYVISAMVLLFFWGLKEKILPKGWIWILLAFGMFGVVMLSSRMEILVLCALAGVYALYYGYRSGNLKKVFLGLLAGMVVLAGIIAANPTNRTRFKEMLDFSSDYTENAYGGRSLRIEKWKNALETYAKHPLLGTGAGDMMDELAATYRKNDFQIALQHRFNPHNQYLQTLMTYGPMGFILLVGFYVSLAFSAIRKRSFALLFLLGCFTLSMITESMLERQAGIFFCILLPMLAYHLFAYQDDNAAVKP